jgi:hypothetical protein
MRRQAGDTDANEKQYSLASPDGDFTKYHHAKKLAPMAGWCA